MEGIQFPSIFLTKNYEIAVNNKFAQANTDD